MLDFYGRLVRVLQTAREGDLPRPAVQAALSEGVVLKADVTANDDADKALLARIGIPGPPAMMLLRCRRQRAPQLAPARVHAAEEFQPGTSARPGAEQRRPHAGRRPVNPSPFQS